MRSGVLAKLHRACFIGMHDGLPAYARCPKFAPPCLGLCKAKETHEKLQSLLAVNELVFQICGCRRMMQK